jgi:hypothetical protein
MMDTKKRTATLALLDELEIRAVLMRVAARKFRRDVDLLSAMESKMPLEAMPHLRRAIRLRLQALGDAKMGEQEVLASQDFYRLHKRGKTR